MNHMQTQEGTEEILEGQNTYVFHAPFGSDIYLIGKAKRSGNLRKKKMGWMPNYESYGGGWDKTKREIHPQFVPFSEKHWAATTSPKPTSKPGSKTTCSRRAARRAAVIATKTFRAASSMTSLSSSVRRMGRPLLTLRTGFTCCRKKVARVKPVPVPPDNAMPVVANMTCAKWGYENPHLADEGEALPGSRQEWEDHRFARSPKTGEKIRWGEETFEETKHLWGSYGEAHRATRPMGRARGRCY